MDWTTKAIWTDSSRVGEMIRAWQWSEAGSIDYRVEIVNVPVFPVPDWAYAIVSLPWMTGRIPFCWIGDGSLKPNA